jgi:hypothetical protein
MKKNADQRKCPHCGHLFSYAERMMMEGKPDGRYCCPECRCRVVSCYDCRTKTWTWDVRASLKG